MSRRHNFQTISWFNDLNKRKLLELDPPYQRRSVWNQKFKDYFIDTILLSYPAPAIFLYEDISADGRSVYNVVDGKQRLMTIFEFIDNVFPVCDTSPKGTLRGKYFKDLDDTVKKQIWAYQFLVEYMPDRDESIINDIFDRINRNVAKLTAQELRHARLDGEFISVAEQLSSWMSENLPRNFPRFDPQSKKQMKDVEFTAILLLLIEEGPKGYSQTELDKAFSDRDESWEHRSVVEELFRESIRVINRIVTMPPERIDLSGSRLRNQADFYSLVGSIVALLREGRLPAPDDMRSRLESFIEKVDDEAIREEKENESANRYYQAARSASSDKGPREARVNILKSIILNETI
ncbi:MAG: DUF262 domain-containing protein [Isosphaeraceae bacterium]